MKLKEKSPISICASVTQGSHIPNPSGGRWPHCYLSDLVPSEKLSGSSIETVSHGKP